MSTMNSVPVEEAIIPVSSARPGIQRVGFAGVTIHETANYRRTATARSHAAYMAGAGKNSQVSSHYYVDDERAVRCIPEAEAAWHASDGRTTPGGNMSTVAIEICTNWGFVPAELAGYQGLANETQVSATEKAAAMDRFAQAVDNAAWLTADILHRNGVAATKNMVRQHNEWDTKNRKDCPHNLRKGVPVAWGTFVSKVQVALAQMAGEGTAQGAGDAAQSGQDNTKSTAALPAPEGSNAGAGTGLYRVQVGAFAVQANAQAYAAKVKKAGFTAVLKTETANGRTLYHVQVGAFAVKANAEAYAAKVKAAGYVAVVKQAGG